MTVIVAIACKDGLVLASDSEETVGFGGTPVTMQRNKLFVVGDGAIAAGAGHVNVIDDVARVLDDYKDKLAKGLSQELREDVRLDVAKVMMGYREILGSTAIDREDLQHAPSALFFVGVRDDKGKMKLWYIDAGLPTSDGFAERDGHVATGSGGSFVYGFLNSYDTAKMDLEHAIVRAYGAVKETINTGAYGVGGHVDIAVLPNTGQAKMLDRDEIEKYAAMYAFLKKKAMDAEESNWRTALSYIKKIGPEGLAAKGAADALPNGTMAAMLQKSDEMNKAEKKSRGEDGGRRHSSNSAPLLLRGATRTETLDQTVAKKRSRLPS